MPPLIVFDQITVDGYFAGLGGDIDFLHQRFMGDEFHSFALENIKAASAVWFGRVTYELMARYWPTAGAIQEEPPSPSA